ncbi:MAG: hypothetical protein REI09_09925 [Candidatus Dactylopiibacterium sp.]|nr:hypothetical protein [Candidatus Dactylopiibacterium sp.]
MITLKKASRVRDLACLAFAASMLLSGCGGSDSNDDSGASSSSAASSSVASMEALTSVHGWAAQGAGTTGGASAPATNIYKATNRRELLNALANTNSPTYATNQTAAKNEPKIIYVVGTVYGTDLGTGSLADEAWYKSQSATAANWDWPLYIQSLDTAWAADLQARATAGDADAIATRTRINNLSSARTALTNLQKAQIQFQIPSNTTLLGVGSDAKIVDGYFSINATSNIIIRNLGFEAPLDLTASYDNDKHEWNSRYKAISVVTGKQLWIDHCTFSDGRNLDTEILTINGVTKAVQRHDGLLDIEDSSDYITVSYSLFQNHDKTNMVGGSGDGNGYKEREFNRITFAYNHWLDSTQRAPRARFGKFHVYNNRYSGNTDASPYPMSYYIGMGAESRILSESNAFDITGSKASVARVISNLNGYQFKDVGSWYNGQPASAELEAAAKAALEQNKASAQSSAASVGFTFGEYTNALGWEPPYAYTRAPSAEALRAHVDANTGAGKVAIALPGDSGTAASSSSASSAASTCPSDWVSSESGIAGGTPLPASWVFQLTGDLPLTARATYSAGAYTLVSAGALAGSGDGMTMAYHKVTGDFTLIAALRSMEVPTGLNTANVVAGLMLRNGTNPRSAYYAMMLRGNKNLRANYRASDCVSASNANITTLSALPTDVAPVWMKMVRSGQTITVAYSADGSAWTEASPYNFVANTLADEVLVGIAGSSGAATTTANSVFNAVTLTQPASGSSSGASGSRF